MRMWLWLRSRSAAAGAAAVGGAASWGAGAVGASGFRFRRLPRPSCCAAQSRGSPSVWRRSFRGRGGTVGQNTRSAMWVMVDFTARAWIVWTRCLNAP